MLAHEPADFETTTLPFSATDTPVTATAVETVDIGENFNDLLEDAVDQAVGPLIGTVSRADRLIRRVALRAELDTLVAAHRELDVDPVRAVSEALAHFARLHPVSLQSSLPSPSLPSPSLQRAVPQNQALSQIASEKSLAQTSLLSKLAPAYPAMFLALGVLTPFYLLDASGAAGRLWHGESWMLYRLEALAVPLIGGLIVGLVNRRHAVRGTLMANALLAIPALLLPSLLFTLSVLSSPGNAVDADAVGAHNQLADAISSFFSSFANVAPGIVGLTCWPLLSGLGAKAGARLSSFSGPHLPHYQ